MTGYSQQDKYKRLMVAPLNLRERLIGLIRRERKNKKSGHIIIKANSIKLPTLPEGSKYKYDPKSGELLVEHPQ